MSCTNDNDWLDARIAKTKALIEAYEDAILTVGSSGQSYSYDSGQTRFTVTQANISSARDTLKDLYSLLSTLQARRCGAGTRVKPAW